MSQRFIGRQIQIQSNSLMLIKPYTLLITRIFFAGVILTSNTAFANSTQCKDDYEKIIAKEIKDIGTALNKGNYALITEKTDSSIINYAGGKDKYNAILELAANSFKQNKIYVSQVETYAPKQSYIIGRNEFCAVPKQVTISMNGRKMTGDLSFMLAVRPIESKEWKYIDGTGLQKNPDMIYTLFPDLPRESKIPFIE
ncbi:MAG: hypothetical protein ACN6OV_06130 [Acinetobacter sp.]|uniref:hypothetical protein n=1 Tax=Acinetobacter sp. TaxID=472 RepID=UPI003CFFFA59